MASTLGTATRVGKLAAAASRVAGLGSGGVIGGKLCLALAPDAARALAQGRRIVLVSGTNGKTTTTALTTAALESSGPVASNRSGANLANGIVGALLSDRSPTTVLEVDEAVVPWAVAALSPSVVVLLNLSRDQLDRLHEVRSVAAAWRKALADAPGLTVVANADDPLVAWAAELADRVVWVAAGQPWRQDASTCPGCRGVIEWDETSWRCPSCDRARPEPAAAFGEDGVWFEGEGWHPMAVPFPGRCNRANGAMALAAAREFGVAPAAAASRWDAMADVGGRYRHTSVDGRDTRLLLAKNPAGWAEALDLVDDDAAVVAVLNARAQDGQDPSWIWDVPFERLAGRTVACSGERAADLAVRLRYAGVDFTLQPDPLDGVRALPAGRVDVVANYSAFHRLTQRLTRR